jgi:predicted GIY-YIG superfamily endonuclease
LVYSESFATKEEAMQREWRIKRLTKGEKETLVEHYKNKIEEHNSIKATEQLP